MKKNNDSQNRATPLKTIALAAMLAIVFWSIQTSAYPLHNGDYLFWSQMPTAAQVLADMKGKNDLDTAARQHAALTLLTTLVNVAADGTGKIPWPPRELELIGAYINSTCREVLPTATPVGAPSAISSAAKVHDARHRRA
jgi:hypothetical protein